MRRITVKIRVLDVKFKLDVVVVSASVGQLEVNRATRTESLHDAGFDLVKDRGRIFSYDVTGGRYEEHDFYAVGSGSTYARGSLKKLFQSQATSDQAVRIALEALYDAADDDSATGGPDIARRIFPVVAVVTRDGVRMMPDADTAAQAERMIGERMTQPNGPRAHIADGTPDEGGAR